MKNKSVFAVAAGLGLVLLSAVVALRQPQSVKAQDDIDPKIHIQKDRNTTSSPMVGIAQGQTIRVNVVNLGDAICPCQRVILNFRDADGQLLRRSDGSVVQHSMELGPGRATSLDLNYDELAHKPFRLQLRAIASFASPGTDVESGGFERTQPVHDLDSFATTVEVFDSASGRSGIVIWMHPAELKGFNPQPDPPR
jgi:hypothetical protein